MISQLRLRWKGATAKNNPSLNVNPNRRPNVASARSILEAVLPRSGFINRLH
jgi:hypothetical protein